MENINIVLLPGWKNDKRSLYIFKNLLDKYANLIFIDFPILIDNKPLTIEDYIMILRGKIQNLNNVILLGHSFGAKLACFYALRYEVKGLILIAPSAYIKMKLKTKILIGIAKIFNFFKLSKPKFLKGSSNYIMLNDLEKITFKNVLKYLNKEELNSIKVKTIIYGFKNDNCIKKSDLIFLNKNIKTSKMKMLDGDHFSYIEHALDIATDIGDFLNELD